MTLTQLLMALGILVSAGVALAVAYLHRKQMRQIELYKVDPTVGLVPPSSRLTRFVSSRWDTVLGFAGPAFVLIIEFMSRAPVTRLTVFSISAALAMMFTNFVMILVFRMQQRNTERVREILELHESQLENSSRILGVLEKMRT
jgi:hypothetical protein